MAQLLRSLNRLVVSVGLIILIGGCSTKDRLVEQNWELLEKRADETGRARMRPVVRGAVVDQQESRLAIDGRVHYEREVDRWNVYKVTERRMGALGQYFKRRVVVDPVGKPYPGQDDELEPDQIKDLRREPTGLGWVPTSLDQHPCRIKWSLRGRPGRAVRLNGLSVVDSSGSFTVTIGRDDLVRIAGSGARFVVVTFVPEATGGGGPVQAEAVDLEIDRDTIMKPLD